MQFDLLRSESHDLSQEGLWQHIFSLLGQGDWILLASPPCETFSRVRHHQPGPRPLRSASYPRGFPWLSNKHRLQVDQSNYFIDHHEIPASLWQWESVRELQVSTKAVTFAIFQCMFEAPASKPTRFLTTLHPWLAHSVLASASQGGRSSAQQAAFCGGRSSVQQAGSGRSSVQQAGSSVTDAEGREVR